MFAEFSIRGYMNLALRDGWHDGKCTNTELSDRLGKNPMINSVSMNFLIFPRVFIFDKLESRETSGNDNSICVDLLRTIAMQCLICYLFVE